MANNKWKIKGIMCRRRRYFDLQADYNFPSQCHFKKIWRPPSHMILSLRGSNPLRFFSHDFFLCPFPPLPSVFPLLSACCRPYSGCLTRCFSLFQKIIFATPCVVLNKLSLGSFCVQLIFIICKATFRRCEVYLCLSFLEPMIRIAVLIAHDISLFLMKH